MGEKDTFYLCGGNGCNAKNHINFIFKYDWMNYMFSDSGGNFEDTKNSCNCSH